MTKIYCFLFDSIIWIEDFLHYVIRITLSQNQCVGIWFEMKEAIVQANDIHINFGSS